jgi:hypothetical protein
MTRISQDLLAAYHATDYSVLALPGPFIVHIDQYSAQLKSLHAQHRVASSAMLTAFNPYSTQLPFEENVSANAALAAELAARSLSVIPASGADPTDRCAPEPGFLILGIAYDVAFEIARKYRQNAFVFADESAIPRLGLCE